MSAIALLIAVSSIVLIAAGVLATIWYGSKP